MRVVVTGILERAGRCNARTAWSPSEGSGGGVGGGRHRVSVEQQWRRASARGEARSTVGGTESRKIQVAP